VKFFEFFVNAIFWFWAFIAPILAFGLIGLWIYSKSEKNLPILIILLILGAIVGVIVAEKIRRKVGLSHFFSRTMASPDLDPKEDQIQKK
jgi:hypothetical protein